jgi:glucose/mannose-6-phosphate isomerase
VIIDLDDEAALAAHDPSEMLGAVAALPSHCAQAYVTGRDVRGLPSLDGISSVTYCGMGGSAVAGDMLRVAFRDRLHVPVDVNRSPELPEYAGPHTLVVVASYSGDTSETLSAFREATARGCRLIAVTAGGRLSEECAEHEVASVTVPEGFAPRAAVGHIAFGAFGALESAGLLPPLEADVDETVAELVGLAGELGPGVPTAGNSAKGLADRIGGRTPVVWGAEGIGAVAAMRWKTQMNENGKVPAWSSSMSELDHNEVVGWSDRTGMESAVIMLRHDGEPHEVAARFPLSAGIARDAGADVEEVFARGRSSLARLLTLMVVGDFTSVYVGLRRGVDPTPVRAIDRLKAALSGGTG